MWQFGYLKRRNKPNRWANSKMNHDTLPMVGYEDEKKLLSIIIGRAKRDSARTLDDPS
jgi:hypothetical protein